MLVDLTWEAGISLSHRRGLNSREGDLEAKFDVHSSDKSAEILFLVLWGSEMIHVHKKCRAQELPFNLPGKGIGFVVLECLMKNKMTGFDCF
jgi:hypothetical protein